MKCHHSNRGSLESGIGRAPFGFTLLELLLVVGILSTLALGTISLMDERDEEFRFDQTKVRLKYLRQSVVGDPRTHLADPPAVSGFVSDVGRLPNTLAELFLQGNMPLWSVDPVSGVGAGWRGPYLHSTAEVGGAPVFYDGWGNTGDLVDFGWRFEPNLLTGELVMQSYGADGMVGGSSVYEQDYPASGILVHASETLVDISGWRVTLVLHNQGQHSKEQHGDDGGSSGGNGSSGISPSSGDSDDGGTVTICHKPGTPAQATLVIPASALSGHLGHGDYLGSCDESSGDDGGDESGDTDVQALPLETMTIRLRLYYPQSGSMNWPAEWPQTDAQRDASPYLSQDVVISAGSIANGEHESFQVSFGAGPKLVPFGVRALGVVFDTSGSLVGGGALQVQEVLLRPRFSTPTITLNWNLD